MSNRNRLYKSSSRISWFGMAILVTMLCALFAVHLAQAQPAQQASVSLFATGLNNPRGLKFGPDGYL